MASRSSRRRGLLAGALAAAAVALALPASAPTAPPDAREANRLDAAIRFLEDVQNPDGGFSARPGQGSDPHGVSQWAALAFAAAGVNPRDQGYSDVPTVHEYLAARAASLSGTGELALTLLVANASGTDPHDFGGVDLAATVVSRLDGDGFAPAPGEAPTVEETALAATALGSMLEPSEQGGWIRGVRWLVQRQNSGGGWSEVPGGASDPWLTGLALSALAAGPATPEVTSARIRARAWLHAAPAGDGGLATPGASGADARASAGGALAAWAAGDDPRRLRGGQVNLLDWLAARQQVSGAVHERPGTAGASVISTALAALAFAAEPPPIPAPGRRGRKARPANPEGEPRDPAPKSVDPPAPSAPLVDLGPAPTFGATGRPERKRGGVRRVKRDRDLSGGTNGDPGTGEGDGDGGSVATPGAPDRAGGGGGVAGETAAFAPAATAGATVTGKARKGGATAKAGRGTAEISGTVIGVAGDEAGEAGGRSQSAAGLAGSQAGHGDTPWLALAIAGGVVLGLVAGPGLERRRTRLAL